MKNKVNFIITGATAAMLLLPMRSEAQQLRAGQLDRIPVSMLQKAEKYSPADLRKSEEKAKASYPKLPRGGDFSKS